MAKDINTFELTFLMEVPGAEMSMASELFQYVSQPKKETL
jgi:hypothetical protein